MADCEIGPSRRTARSRKRRSTSREPGVTGSESVEKRRKSEHQRLHDNDDSFNQSAEDSFNLKSNESSWFNNSFSSHETHSSSSRITRQTVNKKLTSEKDNHDQIPHEDVEEVQYTSTPKAKKGKKTSVNAMDSLDDSDLFLAEISVSEALESNSTPQPTNGKREIKVINKCEFLVPTSVTGVRDKNKSLLDKSSMLDTQGITQCTCNTVRTEDLKPCMNHVCTPFNFSYVDSGTPSQDVTVSAYFSQNTSQLTHRRDTQLNSTRKCVKNGQHQKEEADEGTQLMSSLCESSQLNSHRSSQILGTCTGNGNILDSQLVSQGREPWSQEVTQIGTQPVTAAKDPHVYTSTQLDSNMNNSNCDMFNDSFQNPDILSQIEEICSQTSAVARRPPPSSQCSQRSRIRKSQPTNFEDELAEIEKGLEQRRKEHKATPDNRCANIENGDSTRTCQKPSENDKRVTRGSSGSTSAVKEQNLKSKQSSNMWMSKGTVKHLGEFSSQKSNVNNDASVKSQHQNDSGVVLQETEPVSVIQNCNQSKNKGESSITVGLMQDKTSTTSAVSPAGPTSLQESIKQRLMANAGQKTPQGPQLLVDQLRRQLLDRVQAEEANQNAQMEIGPFYGLPSRVQKLFQSERGISQLYDWQEECLQLPAVLERQNLIYSLPTSGGKTLVAEILILRELMCHKKDALLILPFVSIVQEKVRNLSQFAVQLDFLVEEYAGSKGKFPPVKRRQMSTLYVATIEKAQSITNSLIETDRLNSIGLVVVDELHMLGEGGSRGATLESTLMKILYAGEDIHMIGMSATLNNIGDLKQFMNAEVYTNDFRPVKLTEYIKQADNIYMVNDSCKCPEDQFLHDRIVFYQYKPEMTAMDPDQLLGLALEVIPNNSCLFFCPTKKHCENVALMLCKLMVKYKREMSNVKKLERKALLKELYKDNDGKICPVLQYTVHFGVAYHHSGLTMDERKLIEEAYSCGTLCLLACTSTLAAGVNLPAKRVILRSPYVGQNFISRSQYKQMVGRAGRAGIDTTGESILICKPEDRERVCELLMGPVEFCHSSLMYNEGKGIRNLLLSSIGLKLTPTTAAVFKFLNSSLITVQQSTLKVDLSVICQESLQQLVTMDLVVQKRNLDDVLTLEVTELGRATFKGPIDPDYSNRLYKDLKKAEESLVLSNFLHLLYLVTPYDMVTDTTPPWLTYFNQMNTMNSTELKVASLIGVPEAYIALRASNKRCRMSVDEFTVRRFYLTLILYELWKQKTVWDVAEKFQLPRGNVQNLLSSAAGFASCVHRFCQELEEFWAYKELMVTFVKRLSYCVQAELIPLMEIPGVKQGRAKLMYNAGYTTLSAIASADPDTLVKQVENMPRKVARQIVASAKLLLNEKAGAMMEEVEDFVAIPAGVSSLSVVTPQTPSLETPVMSQESISHGEQATSQGI